VLLGWYQGNGEGGVGKGEEPVSRELFPLAGVDQAVEGGGGRCEGGVPSPMESSGGVPTSPNMSAPPRPSLELSIRLPKPCSGEFAEEGEGGEGWVSPLVAQEVQRGGGGVATPPLVEQEQRQMLREADTKPIALVSSGRWELDGVDRAWAEVTRVHWCQFILICLNSN
jgi:hypothetical protein